MKMELKKAALVMLISYQILLLKIKIMKIDVWILVELYFPTYQDNIVKIIMANGSQKNYIQIINYKIVIQLYVIVEELKPTMLMLLEKSEALLDMLLQKLN